jgi:hypothetical protein
MYSTYWGGGGGFIVFKTNNAQQHPPPPRRGGGRRATDSFETLFDSKEILTVDGNIEPGLQNLSWLHCSVPGLKKHDNINKINIAKISLRKRPFYIVTQLQ